MYYSDHIVHHILTIYALGASPEEIQEAYNHDKIYQKPALPMDGSVVKAMRDEKVFIENLTKEQHYPNFLSYFQREIENKGVPDVLNEYLFAEDERAEGLLVRMFAGSWPQLSLSVTTL